MPAELEALLSNLSEFTKVRLRFLRLDLLALDEDGFKFRLQVFKEHWDKVKKNMPLYQNLFS